MTPSPSVPTPAPDELRKLVLAACEDLGRFGLPATDDAVAAIASLVVNASRLGSAVDAAAGNRRVPCGRCGSVRYEWRHKWDCEPACSDCHEAASPVPSPSSPTTQRETDPYFVLDFCEGAIRDAITLEDGLDAAAGQSVLDMIARAQSARLASDAGGRGEEERGGLVAWLREGERFARDQHDDASADKYALAASLVDRAAPLWRREDPPAGSCWICGRLGRFAIWHDEHPEIGACLDCREARHYLARARAEAEAKIRQYGLIRDNHDEAHERAIGVILAMESVLEILPARASSPVEVPHAG